MIKFLKLIIQQSIIGSIIGTFLLTSCSITKNVSSTPPYTQCIGRQFILKEDVYIFQDNDSSKYSIAAQYSGITGIPPLVDKKYLSEDYFGKNNRYLTIKGIITKGSVFTIIKVIERKTFEMSYLNFLISFDDLPFTKKGIITTAILNLDNPPYTKTWSDPPIFDAKLVEPLPSDGTWWK